MSRAHSIAIESTFIADARFLKANWPRPDWQPNWYCGTCYDYIYPPALAVDLVKQVPDSLVEFQQASTTSIRLRARIEPGQSLLVRESSDPYWRAYAGGAGLRRRGART